MQVLPYPRTGYACAALHAADSAAPIGIALIAHALSSLLNCLHAYGAGCLYSNADDDVTSERSCSARAACASGYGLAGHACMGGGLPLDVDSTSTGMHRLSRLARKFQTFETGAFLCPGG